MKTPKTKFLFLAAVPAVCVLAALSGVLVCESSLPYMTKYSFIMLLLAGLCVLLVLMINSYEHVSEQLKGGLLVKKEEELEAAKVKQQETDQKLQASQKELRALQFQLDELKAKISAFRPETAKGSAPASETELLRKKCEAIENFGTASLTGSLTGTFFTTSCARKSRYRATAGGSWWANSTTSFGNTAFCGRIPSPTKKCSAWRRPRRLPRSWEN